MVDDPVKFLDLKRENAAFEPQLSKVIDGIVASGWYVGGDANERFEKN